MGDGASLGSIADWAWNDWATLVLLVPGLFLALTGSVGVLRMPDFYSRLHPAGKSDTMAQGLILFSLMFQADDPMVMIKLGLLTALLFVTAPTSTHAITKAAELDKNMPDPWTRDDDEEKLRWRAQPPIKMDFDAAGETREQSQVEELPPRSMSGEFDTGKIPTTKKDEPVPEDSEPTPEVSEPETSEPEAPEPEASESTPEVSEPEAQPSSLFAPPSIAKKSSTEDAAGEPDLEKLAGAPDVTTEEPSK